MACVHELGVWLVCRSWGCGLCAGAGGVTCMQKLGCGLCAEAGG